MAVNIFVSLAAGTLMGWLLKGKFNKQKVLQAAAAGSEAVQDANAMHTMGEGGEYKLVLVARTDLKMGKGKVAAQCSHAAVSCYKQLAKRNSGMLEEWEYYGQPKVVTKVSSEEELQELAGKARKLGLVTAIIQDAGRTQIAPGSKTVLGVGPGPAALVDQITGHLKLY